MARCISKDWWPHKTITRWCNVTIFTGNILQVFPIRIDQKRLWKKIVIEQQNCACACLRFGWTDSFHCLLLDVQWAAMFWHDIWCWRYLAPSLLMQSYVSGNTYGTSCHTCILFTMYESPKQSIFSMLLCGLHYNGRKEGVQSKMTQKINFGQRSGTSPL